MAIETGLVLSVGLFLMNSAERSIISNVVSGDRVMSRTMRPIWEMRVLRKEGDRILLVYLQGHLFFGSVQRLAAALAMASSGERVQYCILSFARVQIVDPSAAHHIKLAVDKAEQGGCMVIYCRMNPQVREAMVAKGVVNSRDTNPQGPRPGESFLKELSKALLPIPMLPEESPGDRIGHYFKQETDALDYCEDKIMEQFYYTTGSVGLKLYMQAYFEARTNGDRLDENFFEEMNNIPAGTMAQLQPFCRVRTDLGPGEKVTEEARDCPLLFVLRGGVAVVELLPELEGSRGTGVEAQLREDLTGFSFYPGKRLHKRYPLGHVAGKAAFLMNLADKLIDPERIPHLVVSSRLSSSVEIWVLHRDQWERLPHSLKSTLMDMLCCQHSLDIQHSRLQER